MRLDQSLMPRYLQAIAAMSVVFFASACTDLPTADPSRLTLSSVARATRTVPFDVFGIASQFPTGGQPCSAPEYRQFDFWLGKWDARRTDTNALSGTDVITTQLGGCALEESWVDGRRGRSLNAYDASIRQWTQFWVYAGGGAFTPLLLQGQFANDEMAMRYDRTSPTGVFVGFPPPAGVRFQFSDAYEWIPDPETGSVYQLDRRAFDGGTPFLAFLLRYDRVTDVTPIAVNPTGICQTRAQNRQFDFMLGNWSVYAGRGNPQGAPQATVSFTTDLGDCLVEEHLDEAPDYRGWSFNSWSLVTEHWHRTYVDNAGHRIALSGGLSGGSMVMSGSMASPSGPVMLRVTWEPVSATEVTQSWEFSRDNGVTWPVSRIFTYIKR